MNQVAHYFSNLFSTEGFPPRWLCGFWTPFQGWLYILADLGIWSAYFAIPLTLLYFAKKRADLPFSNLFWLFAAFILACGMSHFLDAMMFWWPAYRLLGLVDVFTAIISWITVLVLIPVIPKALALKSPKELEILVKARTQQLEAAEERYRLVVAGSNDGIWDWDLVKDERYWSDRLYEILGRPRKDHPLTSEEFYDWVHPEDREHVQSLLQAHFENPAIQYRTEVRFLHADGSYRYCLTRGEAQRNKEGQPIRMAGMITDITALKESEERLRHTAQQLSQSNRDLAQFATVASHDLKTPLRKVGLFCEMVLKDEQSILSPEAMSWLQKATQAAGTMQSLIEDLLALARIANKQPIFQSIDLKQVLKMVKQNLEPMIQEKKAQIEAEQLGMVYGDEFQLTQLLQNLIENGLKYQPEGQMPVIKVRSACFDGQFCEIQVQDNGIGIKPEYATKIFEPFQRLHGKDSPYPGSGIGLSICQRIVERHGGSIRVESQPGEGTCFRVILPQQSSRHDGIVTEMQASNVK